jgi:uncharacterized protein YhfF
MRESRKRIQFGEEQFLRQILAKTKTVTLCPAAEYALPWGEYSDGGWETGDEVELYDAAGCLRGILEVTQVYPITFGEAATTLWQADGYSSSADFRADYQQAWPEAGDMLELVATHFRLKNLSKVWLAPC